MGDAPVVSLDKTIGSIKYWLNAPFDLAMQFLLAFSVGLLAYYLTWTILLAVVSALAMLPPSGRFNPARLASYMNLLCWSVALWFAFLSHCWWDGLL
jgi:hypothetical protein